MTTHRCRFCGCTDARACDGGCAWADRARTICTRCIERVIDLAALRLWAAAHPEATAAIARALQEIAA